MLRKAISAFAAALGLLSPARAIAAPGEAPPYAAAFDKAFVPGSPKKDEIFGYGVDAGTGSFFDPVAGRAAADLLKADPDAWESWQTDGEVNGPKAIAPYSFLLDLPLGEANAIMFHSGWGDGFYASWFGYDAKGNVAALVTDFQTIDWATAKW